MPLGLGVLVWIAKHINIVQSLLEVYGGGLCDTFSRVIQIGVEKGPIFEFEVRQVGLQIIDYLIVI